MMRAQLADMRERGEPVAALWASEETIYGRFGYGLASQDVMIARLAGDTRRSVPTCRDASGRRVSSDTTRLYASSRGSSIAFASGRPGSSRARGPGGSSASSTTGTERRRGAGELNRVLLEIDGRPAGYALYRIKLKFEDATNKSQVQVLEAIGESPLATRELWRFLLAIDWVDEIRCELLPADHPLFLLVAAAEPSRLEGLRRPLASARRRGMRPSRPARRRATVASPSTCTRDPILPDNVGTWTVEAGTRPPFAPPCGRPAGRSGAGCGIPRRLHVRRARARRARRGGRPRRRRPGRCALPRRREAMVPGDFLTLAIV